MQMELSTAIMCPSVAMQLVGMKKAQQLLAEPHLLELYLTVEEAKHLRTCFMGLYGLENPSNMLRMLEVFKKNPDGYILKPQREGGGNNLTGAAAIAFLRELESTNSLEETLKGYILMEKITSPSQPNYLMRDQKIRRCDNTVAELGLFGTLL
jgi:glutathione synthase